MSSVLLDTHALIWYLERSPALSVAARGAIKACLEAGGLLYVSAVTLAEILYLEEKKRLSEGTFHHVMREMTTPDGSFVEAPFSAAIADRMREVSRDKVPDFPDRMITATAIHLDIPFVTADSRIRETTVPTIW